MVGFPVTVIGVMPQGFSYPDGSELWLPWGAFSDGAGRINHNFHVVGALRPGVTFGQAQADLSAIARALKQRYPSPYQAKDASAISLRRHIGGDMCGRRF